MTAIATSPTELCASGVSWTKSHSNTPIGSMEASVVPTTTVIGRSRSVISTWPPWRRARVDSKASLMPLAIGEMSLMSVQIAAIAIAPAPMKRTSCAKAVETASVMSPVAGSVPTERIGSRIP